MRDFTERHKPTGRMTNREGEDTSAPFASTYVCDREECRTRAQQWVAASTNSPAFFVPFESERSC